MILLTLFLAGCNNDDFEKKEHEEKVVNNEGVFLEKNEDAYELYNYVDGYALSLKEDYTLDQSVEEVRTRLQNDQTTIDIYYDDFEGSINNKETYMGYANKFAENKKYHQVLRDERIKVNGFDVHLLEWTRDKLKHVDQDKNYYYSAEIAKNDLEVYTVMVKSTKEIGNLDELLESFKLIPQKAEAQDTSIQDCREKLGSRNERLLSKNVYRQ